MKFNIFVILIVCIHSLVGCNLNNCKPKFKPFRVNKVVFRYKKECNDRISVSIHSGKYESMANCGANIGYKGDGTYHVPFICDKEVEVRWKYRDNGKYPSRNYKQIFDMMPYQNKGKMIQAIEIIFYDEKRVEIEFYRGKWSDNTRERIYPEYPGNDGEVIAVD
ncbi:MAG: hypothetical protein JEZ07_17670 [Phycisphaerae bacterium]|nr:hypothetical protein [Phycisphaerae bacterium]